MPRARAAVHTTGRPNCTDAMPPQACATSPLASSFTSGGAGEWSLTTMSMVPSASAAHSASWSSSPRTGGQHLNWGAPSGIDPALSVR